MQPLARQRPPVRFHPNGMAGNCSLEVVLAFDHDRGEAVGIHGTSFLLFVFTKHLTQACAPPIRRTKRAESVIFIGAQQSTTAEAIAKKGGMPSYLDSP